MRERTAQWVVIALLAAGVTVGLITAVRASQEANAGQRTGWCYLESLVAKSKKSTPQKIHQTDMVIRHLLQRIGEPDCVR